jgi:hypothetical protein
MSEFHFLFRSELRSEVKQIQSLFAKVEVLRQLKGEEFQLRKSQRERIGCEFEGKLRELRFL